MNNRLEVHNCTLCENSVLVLEAGEGDLSCCGTPMTKLLENTTDASTEKHVPTIEEITNSIRIKVGNVAHPMLENHYIKWIEVVTNNKSYFHFLKPGDTPEAIFGIMPHDILYARAYCNLHGLWKSL